VLQAERLGAPFVIYREAAGTQVIQALDPLARTSIGRHSASDVPLPWDSEVSRAHALLELVGREWTVIDDGLSRNGTYVNGVRLGGRRRLRDGDIVRVGSVGLTFRAPAASAVSGTAASLNALDGAVVTPAQRRVLVAMCRPFKQGTAHAVPASNPAIAAELFLSVDAVKTHVRALFACFGVEALPQNRKRARLVELALENGIVTEREL
jgi:pSer/pThr/pTyr-binding forkhead associated (FHA) protein